MERDELKTNEDALLRRQSRKPSPKRNELKLEPHFCKGCGLCVDNCPTGTLLLEENPRNKWGLSVMVDAPEYCIGCRMCEMQCPDFAIFVQREFETKEEAK